MAQASTSCSFKQISREQKVCLKIFEAGMCSGEFLAFARRMKPWISAGFGQWEVRAGKFLWFFRRTTLKCCKPPLLIWSKQRKNTLSNYFPSPTVWLCFPLSTIPEQLWQCCYSYLWFSWYYHIRGGGLPFLPEILVNVSRAGGFCFHVPKTSSRESWMPQVSPQPLHRETPRGHCFGQVCPEGIIMSKWIKSHHREQIGIIFAIPQRFRPWGTRLQWSAGATRQVWWQQNQGFFKDISFISAFSSRGFAAMEEF